MYLGFYGFAKEPFNITPDPEFLYFSPSHKEAFAAVTYGIENRKGFIVLTGEVGTGKTTILRSYLDRADRDEIECVYVFDPNLSFPDLLRLLLHEMGHEIAQREATWMLQWLHWSLVRRYQSGRNVAVIIDEAQNIPVETLEQLRMLSNLETTKEKLVQIVLVGQPELKKKLDLESLRQLKQRIAVRATLQPLTREESREYLRHRVEQASARLDDVFAPAAVKAMVRYGKGIPRRLNIVASNALLTGYGSQRRPVTARIVREVIAELEGTSLRPWMKWVAGAFAALLVVFGLSFGLSRMMPPEAAPYPPPPAAQPSAPAPAQPVSTDRVGVALQMMTKSVSEPRPMPAEPAAPVVAPAPKSDAAPAPAPAEPVVSASAPPEPQAQAVSEKPPEAPPAENKAAPPEPSAPEAKPVEAATPPAQDTPKPEDAKPKPTTKEKPVKVSPEVESASIMTTRVAKPGDTLTKLVGEVYGACNKRLFDAVRQRNPSVTNPDIVLIGQTLVFPEMGSPKAAEPKDGN